MRTHQLCHPPARQTLCWQPPKNIFLFHRFLARYFLANPQRIFRFLGFNLEVIPDGVPQLPLR